MATTQHSEQAKKTEPVKNAQDGASNGIEHGAAQASRMRSSAQRVYSKSVSSCSRVSMAGTGRILPEASV